MEKKKIYWCIQQLSSIGGTEMVSINLMNKLVEYCDITIISVAKIPSSIVYTIDNRINIESLNVDSSITRFDQYSLNYKHEHKYLKFISLAFQAFSTYTFKRSKYKRKIKNMVHDNILICSSLDNYFFAPKGITVYYHFHFNSLWFKNFINRFALRLCRKPNKYIFLSSSTQEDVCEMLKLDKSKTTYIYNPIRFASSLNLQNHNNTILFAGRFEYQKNPLLALEIASELKKGNLGFKLNMYGEGSLKPKMEEYILKNNLSANVSLYPPLIDFEPVLSTSDILLLPSRFEGFPLVKGEAMAFSCPTISSNWGKTIYEMLEEGKDGYIIDSLDPKDYAQKLIEYFSSKDDMKTMKQYSYNKSLALSYDAIIPLWKKLLGI